MTRRLSAEEEVEVLSRAAMAPAPGDVEQAAAPTSDCEQGVAEPTRLLAERPCEYCDKGSWTDSNGIRHRCYFCGGTGSRPA